MEAGEAGSIDQNAEWIDRRAAARLIGITPHAWDRWEATGKTPAGRWVARPGGGRRKVYPGEAVQTLAQSFATFPPAGMVDRFAAAKLFGISERTWSTWEKERGITCGQRFNVPNRAGRTKFYPLAELERLVERLKGEVPPPFPPEGFLGREEARALFGVALKTWTTWESQRRISCGLLLSRPGKPGHFKIYPRAELELIKTNWDQEAAEAEKRLEPYPDPERAGVWRVPVKRNSVAEMEALVDAADLPLITGKRWYWSIGQSGTGSVVVAIDGSPRPSLPRILLGIDDRELLVSHRNGDRLDCRRENLVVRTRAESARSSKKISSRAGRASSSQYKGVCWHDDGRKWGATIRSANKTIQLGRYRDEVHAALAYDAAAKEMFSEHARLNFPDGVDPKIAAESAARAAALEPAPVPPGMIDRYEACSMFDISLRTWVAWERNGRLNCHQWFPLPDGKPGRQKWYPVAELERLREEFSKIGKPYPDPERAGCYRVPLKSWVAQREAIIDAADLPIVEGRNWNWSGRTDGKTEGTVVLATTGHQTPLHRLIAGATDPAIKVAFVNGDALDCRRENLAVRTLAETSHTSRKREMTAGKPCTSRFKGVSHDEKRGKWVVQVRKGELYLNVGRFADELRAAEAYDDCARMLFGPHAYLNIPDRETDEVNRVWAQQVLDGTAKRERQKRQKQKKLEAMLKATVMEIRRVERSMTMVERAATAVAIENAPTIGRRVARKLFGVSPNVWKRWQRLGWLPATVNADGKKRYRVEEIERLLRACGKIVLPYPDPDRVGVWRLPLSGETAKGREALIDADAVTLVQTKRWRFAPAEAGRGGEVQTMNPAKNTRLHYVVMGMDGAADTHLGHRNDDPLDCRRENLVVRTLTDTRANARKQATINGHPCTSRFKGVCLDKRRGRWYAKVKKEGKTRNLGTFRDEIAAAQAYDEAASELFGEHARLNFPDGVDARLESEAKGAAVTEVSSESRPAAA